MPGFVTLNHARPEISDAFRGILRLEDALTGVRSCFHEPSRTAGMCSDGGLVLAPVGVPAGTAKEALVHAASSLLAYESIAHTVVLDLAVGSTIAGSRPTTVQFASSLQSGIPSRISWISSVSNFPSLYVYFDVLLSLGCNYNKDWYRRQGSGAQSCSGTVVGAYCSALQTQTCHSSSSTGD